MIYVLGECDKNGFLVSKICIQRFPEYRQSKEAFFKSIKITPCIGQRKLRINIDRTRELGRIYKISRTTITLIFKKNNFHTYHHRLIPY